MNPDEPKHELKRFPEELKPTASNPGELLSVEDSKVQEHNWAASQAPTRTHRRENGREIGRETGRDLLDRLDIGALKILTVLVLLTGVMTIILKLLFS